MSLVAGVLWTLGTVLWHVIDRAMTQRESNWASFEPTDWMAATCVAASLALFVYARAPNRNPRVILNLGLGYVVLTALSIGLIVHWDPVPHTMQVQSTISWIGAVLLMYAAIVPTNTPKMLIVGLISVSMNPLGMLVAHARGTWDFGPWYFALLMHYPDFLLVGVAVVISHVVTRLGQQVTKAREMGAYQLGDLLGRGGMGEVYRATHRMLARPAAIKLIRPEMLGAGNSEAAQMAVKRFHREATAAALLRSPHTVELYDFGVTQDQTLYFVMEMLEGMDLESLVRKHGPLPAARVIHILRQVCESLEEAHVAGLIHRDVKPANIHVGRLGLQNDFVKVLDFGLVKSVAGPGSEHSLGTSVGLTPGTPAYMAPEMGFSETVDGRADIYALGCVAYYLLTGKLVFEAENAFQMFAKHLRDEPVPPFERAGIRIPTALEQLVLRCLAKKPEDRPQSAGELQRLLEAIDLDAWSDSQAADWWKENRLLATAAEQ